MLDWIKKAFKAAAGVVPEAIREWVYQQVYAVFSFLGTIVNHVASAWSTMFKFADNLWHALDSFGISVYNFLYKVVKVMIPNVIDWAFREIGKLQSWAWGYISTLLRALDSLRQYLLAQVESVVRWINEKIWTPLMAEVKSLWATLQKWGYTAYWYVTHPQALADLLLQYLLVSLQKSAWTVARVMGEFIFKTVMANIPRFATLIEQIIADVL